MILMPGKAARSARDALLVWGRDVVPSLFPYMVFCRMLAAQLSCSRIPAAPVSALLGMMGGSPSGAGVLAAYSSQLSRRQLCTLCALTGTISPMFLMGTVGGWMDSPLLGRLLLSAHLSGAAFAALCVYLLTKEAANPAQSSAQGNPELYAAPDPVAGSITAILSVGGYIVFYSVAAGLIRLLPGLPGNTDAIIHAMLEAAGGMHAITVSSYRPDAKAVWLAAASGFSGLSILSQNLFFLRPFGVRFTDLVLFGILRALGAAAAMSILLLMS